MPKCGRGRNRSPHVTNSAKTHGFHERLGLQYVLEHAVYDLEANVETRLDRMGWADWCRYGDLLYAKDRRLFRLAVAGGELRPTEEARPS